MKLDMVGYIMLMNCFCRNGEVDEVMELFGEMKVFGCRVDVLIYNVIFRGLCGEG